MDDVVIDTDLHVFGCFSISLCLHLDADRKLDFDRRDSEALNLLLPFWGFDFPHPFQTKAFNDSC